MSERQFGGFEQEPLEPSTPVVEHESRQFGRQALFGDLDTLRITLAPFDVSTVQPTSEMPIHQRSTPVNELCQLLDSVERRTVELMGPMRHEFLQEDFSFLTLTPSEQPADVVPVTTTTFQERWHWLDQILTPNELASVEELDRLIDVCRARHERRGFIAYKTYQAYRASLGSWPKVEGAIRPWHNQAKLRNEFPLRKPETSDITPLPEYKEND